MGIVCVALMILLAACGGGSTNTTASGGASLSGGTDISGRTILFEIKSGPSNFFFVPAVNGAKGRRRYGWPQASDPVW